MTNNKDLVREVYQQGINLGLNDELSFQAAIFVKEFMPHELEYQSYYLEEVLKRFKNGSIIAYADSDARIVLISTYQTVVQHGGLFNNWYNSQEA